ncbi:CCR4-NOT transcription complex subunit 4, partial [Camellia lanceoleosa]
MWTLLLTVVVVTNKDRENKPQKAKLKKNGRTDLSNVRVLQRKMAYIIGLPLSLADEELLLQKEYFGQYGKVSKVSVSRTVGGAIQQFVNDTCSVYITYSKEEEAIQCINQYMVLASFGAAKYCHAWLRNMPCTNPACLYLHSIGAEEDSLVHQIVGTTHNMQQRSGTHATGAFSSHVTCSVSSKDQNRPVKTPNKSVVDVVGWSSSGPDNGNAAEDGKIIYSCSEFSSVAIDKDHLEVDYSNAMLCRVSFSSHLPMAVTRDKDSQEYSIKLFREPSKFSVLERADFTPSDACITKGQSCLTSGSGRQALPGSYSDVREDLLPPDAQRLKASDILSQGFSVLPSHPIRISDCSNGHNQQRKATSSLSDFNVDGITVHNYVDEAFIPFTCVNSSSTESDRSFRSSNLFSSEEIVEQLRRLADDNITNDNYSSAFDAVESSIISNVLSHDQSRFAFATEENSVNQATFSNICQVSKKRTHLPDSMEKEEHYQCGPQHHVNIESILTPSSSFANKPHRSSDQMC